MVPGRRREKRDGERTEEEGRRERAVILRESRCSAGVLGRVQDPCINTGRPPGNTTPWLPGGRAREGEEEDWEVEEGEVGGRVRSA